jgi:hypothetical protein
MIIKTQPVVVKKFCGESGKGEEGISSRSSGISGRSGRRSFEKRREIAIISRHERRIWCPEK